MHSSAEEAQIALFAPYCGGLREEATLRQTLPLLHQGRFEGQRALGQGKGHDYLITWGDVRSPLAPCPCELTFPDLEGVQYSFVLPAHQFASWLMRIPPNTAPQDLPDEFWRWLLLERDAS